MVQNIKFLIAIAVLYLVTLTISEESGDGQLQYTNNTSTDGNVTYINNYYIKADVVQTAVGDGAKNVVYQNKTNINAPDAPEDGSGAPNVPNDCSGDPNAPKDGSGVPNAPSSGPAKKAGLVSGLLIGVAKGIGKLGL